MIPSGVRAQSVRGVVVSEASAPMSGVLVQLLDSNSAIAAHALSGAGGEFTLRPPRSGTFRLRTLRIGFRPVVSDPIVLAAGAEVTRRLQLNSVPISLDTVRVSDHAVCRSFGDSAAIAFQVWDQARAALTAAQLTAASQAIFTRTVVYHRVLYADGQRVRRDSTEIKTGYMRQPWLSLAPDSLHRVGYVVAGDKDTTVFYAPGLDALLSPVFLEDHCFHLVGDDRRIGIAFEPAPNRRRIPEIHGTLWVDRATAALQELQYGYVNVLPELESAARGSMRFARMADGAWAISAWNIRMPVTQTDVQSMRYGGPQIRLTAIDVAGGELALAMRGTDTLWSHERMVLAGSVVDSSSGSRVPGARLALAGTSLAATADSEGLFRLTGPLPGEYQLEVRTASLDSVGAVYQSSLMIGDSARAVVVRVPAAKEIAAMFCGERGFGSGGVVLGRVASASESTNAAGATVVAEWQTKTLHVSGAVADAVTSPHSMETKTDSHGLFRLCGLPLETRLAVSASAVGASTRQEVVTIPVNGRFARADLALDAARVATATFSGVVVVDSTSDPVIGAEVGVPALGLSTTTDERGVFWLSGIAPGAQKVVVRRIGYGPMEAELTFGAGQSLRRTVHLGRAVVLDSVVVTDRMNDRAMGEFEDNRRLGLGHFLTREDLKPLEGVSTGSALATLPGIAIVNRGTYAWVKTSRPPTSIMNSAPPDASDAVKGAPGGCYAVVYLDSQIVFSNKKIGNPPRLEPLFDINSVPVAEIEAIEYYASPAQTPARYNTLNSNCGVIVIHTIRYHAAPPP